MFGHAIVLMYFRTILFAKKGQVIFLLRPRLQLLAIQSSPSLESCSFATIKEAGRRDLSSSVFQDFQPLATSATIGRNVNWRPKYQVLNGERCKVKILLTNRPTQKKVIPFAEWQQQQQPCQHLYLFTGIIMLIFAQYYISIFTMSSRRLSSP